MILLKIVSVMSATPLPFKDLKLSARSGFIVKF